ncbi:MAG: hypothetical protein GX678_07935 [Actinomycetales bacterium]|nr:hypothetical protein [Actinomycetales bacterium]
MSEQDLSAALGSGDLRIEEGGVHADRIILVLHEGDCKLDLDRFEIGYRRANIEPGKQPWFVVTGDTSIYVAIQEFYEHPFGESSHFDEVSLKLLKHFPLHTLQLTSICLSAPDEDMWMELANENVQVAISGPPPVMLGMYAPDFLRHVVSTSGLEPALIPVDDDFMFERYSDNLHSWSEQVLDWDDLYSKETWEFIVRNSPIVATLKNDPVSITGEALERFGAELTAQTEEDFFNA